MSESGTGTVVDAEDGVKRLSVRCPSCGAPPALRVSRFTAEQAGRQPAQTVMMTYQCQRRRCKRVYDLRAGMLAQTE